MIAKQHVDEEELVQRIQAGDERAFQVLFERYVEQLEGYARQWIPASVHRRVSASDVVQEAHLTALRRVADFEHRGEGSFRNWVLKIVELKVRETVREHLLTQKRSTGREVTRGDRPDTHYHPGRVPSPSQFAVASELGELVTEALADLPPDYREVLRLAREERLSMAEIALRMDRSREAVKKLYGRALARFTKALAERRGTMADDGTRDDVVDQLFVDWIEARERGEAPGAEDFVAAHPEHAPALRARLGALEHLDQAFSYWAPQGKAPTRIGEFAVVRELGRGGMGVVYEAEQTSMGRRVALKVLSLAIAAAPQAAKRFQREARAAGRIQHTNIVPVYAFGRHDGHWYYAMELVDGRPLADVLDDIRASRQSPSRTAATESCLTNTGDRDYFRRVAGMFAEVADALHAAHLEGVVHRDVKPGNLLLDEDGLLKIVDFGLARLEDEALALTVSGGILGTPSYMSPEQASGAKRVDQRSDVYSLAATLYETVTLRRPFEGRTAAEIVRRVSQDEVTPPRTHNKRIPADLETILLKALEKDPARRYATADAFAEDLLRFARGHVVEARRTPIWERAWRRIKRNKVRSTLAATAAVAGLLATFFAWKASEESAARRVEQYARLIMAGESELGRSMAQVIDETPEGHHQQAHAIGGALASAALYEEGHHESTAAGTLTRAIVLSPDRPEAYWLRALAPGRSLEARLADLEAARRLGASEQTIELASAQLRASSGLLPDAELQHLVAALPPPATAVDAYFVADLQYRAGRRPEAEALLAQAIRESAHDTAIHYLARRARVRLRRYAGDFAGALEDLHAILALGDDSLGIQLLIASMWQRIDGATAKKHFAAILERTRQAGTEAAWVELLEICWSKHARAWHVRASQEALETHPTSPALTYQRVLGLCSAQQCADALALAERAHRADPEDLVLTKALAYAYASSDRHEDAVEALGAAIEREPNAHELHERQGLSLEALDRHEEAVEAFRRARDLELTCPHAALCLGEALQAAGRPEEALDALAKAAALNPADARVHDAFGLILFNTWRRSEEALAAFDHAVKLSPDYALAHGNRGVVLNYLRRHDEALAAYERAAELAPTSPGPWRGLADALEAMKRWDEAVAAREKAVELASEKLPYQLQLAELLATIHREAEGEHLLRRLIAKHPTDPRPPTVLGRVLAVQGRHDEALELAETALGLDEHRAAAWNVKGGALEAGGDREAAERCFRRAVEEDPHEFFAWTNLGEILFGDEARWRKAEEIADHVLSLSPRFVNALHLKARCHQRREQFDEALAIYAQLIDLEATELVYVNRGALYADDLKAPEKALADFDRAIELNAESVRAHTNRGVVLQRLDRHEEAIEACRRALELDDANPKPRVLMAGSLSFLHRDDEALAQWRILTERFPNNPEGPKTVGLLLLRQGNDEEAATYFEQALALDANMPMVWANYGIALQHLERYEDAERAFLEAERRAPDWHYPPYHRAGLYEEMGRSEGRRGALEKTVRLNPNYPYAWHDLGMLLDDEGDVAHALEALDKAIQLAPDFLMAMENKAWVLHDRARLVEASDAAQALVDARPEEAWTHARHATFLWHAGRFEKAQAALEKAMALDPNDPYLPEQIAMLLFEQARFEDALAHLEAARERFPKHAGLRGLYLEALRAGGRSEEAVRLARDFVAEASVDEAVEEGWGGALALQAAVAGDDDVRRRGLATYEGDDLGPDHHYFAAKVLAMAGDTDGARAHLEKAVDAGLWLPPGSLAYRDLRSAEDEGIQALLARIPHRPPPRRVPGGVTDDER